MKTNKKTEDELLVIAQQVKDVIINNDCTQGEGMRVFANVIYPILLHAPNKSYTLRSDGESSITFSCEGEIDEDDNT